MVCLKTKRDKINRCLTRAEFFFFLFVHSDQVAGALFGALYALCPDLPRFIRNVFCLFVPPAVVATPPHSCDTMHLTGRACVFLQDGRQRDAATSDQLGRNLPTGEHGFGQQLRDPSNSTKLFIPCGSTPRSRYASLLVARGARFRRNALLNRDSRGRRTRNYT